MIKLNEQFQPKHTTILNRLKQTMKNWPEEDEEILGLVSTSIITGTPISEIEQEILDYASKYEKETIKETLQNYVLTKLQKGVNDISLFFIFELDDEFGNFACFDFVETFNEKDLELINKELKSYFVELLEFEPDSYTLNTVVEAMNDPADYGELIKVTATISIKMD